MLTLISTTKELEPFRRYLCMIPYLHTTCLFTYRLWLENLDPNKILQSRWCVCTTPMLLCPSPSLFWYAAGTQLDGPCCPIDTSSHLQLVPYHQSCQGLTLVLFHNMAPSARPKFGTSKWIFSLMDLLISVPPHLSTLWGRGTAHTTLNPALVQEMP